MCADLCERILLSFVILALTSATSSMAFECPKGEFICGNLTKCVEQKYQCDEKDDCGNNADEDIEMCNNFEGWVRSMDNVFVPNANVTNRCELPEKEVPAVCDCVRGRKLICSNKSLTAIPADLPTNTSHLVLMNNKIRDIPLTAFEGMTNLKVLYLSENQISVLRPGVFRDLINLEWLFLVDNNIRSLQDESFTGLHNVYWVRLNHNHLEDLSDGVPFRPMHELKWCDMANNNLTKITGNTFQGEFGLHTLDLSNNRIHTIEKGAFSGQDNLTVLNLTLNNLTSVPKSLANELPVLTTLLLSYNPMRLDDTSFSGLNYLKELDLHDIDIPNISEDMFKDLQSLKIITFKRFEYCKFVHHVRNCKPKTDGISSAENLLEGSILRISVWTIALLTTCGNLNVLISRIAFHTENKVHSIVVSNLCAADFMMGLYLFAIGIQDARFRNNYINFALAWSESWGCNFVGFLALLSTEASVLTLTFISLERFFIVAFPYRFHRLNIKEVVSVLVAIWIVAFILAASPFIFTEYFYGSNGVCFPLHIHDPRLEGWEYSIFIFLGINTLSFTIIISSYCGMFHSIQKTRKRTTALLPGDINYAKRFFFIVLTDCMCWLPLAVVKLIALADMPISESVYAWIVIFILPINSALNPILYTLSTGPFRRVLLQKIKNRRRHPEAGIVPKIERFSNGSHDSRGERLKLEASIAVTGGGNHDMNTTLSECQGGNDQHEERFEL